MITDLQSTPFSFFFIFFYFFSVIFSAVGQSCDTTTPYDSGYRCGDQNRSLNRCATYAVFRTNSYYSSVFNLSFFLGIDRFLLVEANGFSSETEYFPQNQLLLIPIDCKCDGGFFAAELTKITVKGESFYTIAESLEGLTSCKSIIRKNPGVNPWGLGDKLKVVIPLRCACPSSSEIDQQKRILISYPVIQGDTVSNLAVEFNTTAETIVSANNRSGAGFRRESLAPLSTVFIPVNNKTVLGSLAKPREPSLGFPATGIPAISPHKKKNKMRRIGLYIALSSVGAGAFIAIAAALLVIQWRRNKQIPVKMGDMEAVERQQLSLSVRTASDKKVSFEGSADTLGDQIIDATTPRKILIETYTLDDMRKSTEDFASHNLIEDSVFHGRLNGKNLAIKRTGAETISKIDVGLFHGAIHHHPNIMRLLGTCSPEGPNPNAFLVFEYAKNGSLKDWLHGGLAMKSHFIASCYCFLTWNQRLRICLDVAVALQYMHQIMNPPYVHRNIKSRNIFLDEEFNAKVGNFGMAKCVEDNAQEQQQHPYSSHSTFPGKGYLAPEYLNQGIISPGVDIFAYGVVLLEVLSGKTPITRSDEKGEGSLFLSEKIKTVLQSESGAEELRGWMDNALGENYSFDAALTMANLARACVEDDPSLRPNAGEIVEKISRLVEELPEGDQFTFCESSSKPLVRAAANNI